MPGTQPKITGGVDKKEEHRGVDMDGVQGCQMMM